MCVLRAYTSLSCEETREESHAKLHARVDTHTHTHGMGVEGRGRDGLGMPRMWAAVLGLTGVHVVLVHVSLHPPPTH